MACIFLLVVPVLGFGLYMVIRTAMPLFRKVFHKYDELNNSIQENIKGMRVVKSYVREEFEKKSLTGRQEMSARILQKQKKSWHGITH